jgi:hypothetical protein
MQSIIDYIKYFMAIAGAVTIMWRVAVSFQRGEDKTAQIEKEMVTKYDMKKLVDSITLYNYRMERKMNDVIVGQNALRVSYIKHLRSAVNEKTLSLDDFLEYMNGIEWVVSPVEDKRINYVDSFKIKITKKQ